jgi:exosortase
MWRYFLIALAGVFAAIYAGTIRGLVMQWLTSPDASYGVILAAVAGLLIWRRRDRLTPNLDYPIASTAALLTVALGCVMFLAGTIAADLFTTRASLVVVVAGLAWFLAGYQALRALAAPLAFLLLAIPLPEILVNAITLPLQLVASSLAETMLSASGVSVFRDGNVLELPAVTLQVAEACSGLRSAVSLTSVGVLLAWSASGPLVRRASIAVAAIPIAVAANALRIAATGILSETFGAAAARGTWHEVTGWLTFAGSLAALLLLHRAFVAPRPASPDIAAEKGRKAGPERRPRAGMVRA